MTPERFDEMLRFFAKRRPFFPFFVEMTDGSRRLIGKRGVAFGGGVAGYFNDEGALDGFSCEEVRTMYFATPDDCP